MFPKRIGEPCEIQKAACVEVADHEQGTVQQKLSKNI
jgi:hypothetical protein